MANCRFFKFLFVATLLTASTGVTVYFVIFVWPVWADYQEVERLRSKVLSAEHVHFAQPAIFKLFAGGGRSRVRYLQHDPNDGIAIRAAWQEVLNSVPEQENQTAQPLDQAKVKRFLNFVRTRLNDEPPTWWEQAVLGMEGYKRTNVFVNEPEESAYHIAEAGLMAPANTEVQTVGDGLRISIDSRRLTVPASLLKQIGVHSAKLTPSRGISASFYGSKCYLAFHNEFAYESGLICIECESDRVLWHTTVWGDGYVGGGSGTGYFHWVAIKPQGDRVLVYGVSLMGVYIQGIRTDDGSRNFWFGTEYSDWSEE